MNEEPKTEVSEEVLANLELAYQLSKEVVEDLGFKDVKDYENNGELFDSRKHNFYFTDSGRNIKIYGEIGSIYGEMEIRFSLSFIAFELVNLCRRMLSDETAPEVLAPSVMHEIKKRNLNMLTVFDLEPSDVEETIHHTAKNVLKIFITNTPLFLRSGVIDAFEHTKIGYCRNVLKNILKNHWDGLGFKEDFELVSEPQIEEVMQYNLNQKKWFLGNKKQLLNLETLADFADRLRAEYKDAKENYFEHKRSYEILFKNASEEEWQDKWRDICSESFPNLSPKALAEIENYRPFELVNLHLSELYGYDEEYMRKKLIPESRKLRKKRESGTS